jgi:hypothetical protein
MKTSRLPFQTALLTLLALGSVTVRAASMKQEVHGGFFGAIVLESTHTLTTDGLKQRDEDLEQKGMGIFHFKNAGLTITRVDRSEIYLINSPKKRYAVRPIEPIKEIQPSTEKSPDEKSKSKNTVELKKVETKVEGPGAEEIIHEFHTHPYRITMIFTWVDSSQPDKPYTQTYIEKRWTTPSTGALATLEADERKFGQALSEKLLGGKSFKSYVAEFQTALAHQNVSGSDQLKLFSEQAKALEKVQGTAIRSIMVFNAYGGDTQTTPPKSAKTETEPALVEPGDLSGGVGGLVSGMATRWVSHKAEKKMQEKMDERPSWLSYLGPKEATQSITFAAYSEILQVGTPASDPDLFEVPAKYKKVNDL